MLTISQRCERATEIMRAAVASGECTSAVMGVASSRETLCLETASPADGSEVAQADSIYLLASITKTFFGTALMQLAEQGKLLLTDAVVRHIPEFGVNGKGGISIWNLLTHTSGLAEEPWIEVWKRGGSYNEHLAAVCNGWLNFRPGTQYSYCNGSFWILGEIITRTSGLAYPEYMRKHIWEPLGMHDTGFSFSGAQAARMMPVHNMEKEGLFSLPNAVEYFCQVNFGAGGLWSTVPDLIAYGQAHLNALRGCEPALCSTGGTQMMTRRHTKGINDANGNPSYYGLGWGTDDGRGYCLGRGSGFGHGGATATYLWLEPDLDLVFVYLCNMWGAERRASQLALNAVLAE
ncbi:MAG: beta-lactamase family protein [Chloroflexi bacterium]|nr:beta-lactamase family protein [Chloroflexota bacterium]